MARHRALPEDGDAGAARIPVPAAPPGTELAVGDAPLDGELIDGEPVYRAARVPVRGSAGGAGLVDEPELEPAESADSGRISPWVIALLAVAVVVFVGGVLWAVTGPSRNAGTAPAAGAGAGIAIQDGDTGGTTTPVPTPFSPTPRPSASTAASTSTSPAPATSSGGVPTSPSSGAPVAVAATAQVTIENQWSPNNVQVRVVVSAAATAVNAWSVHFSCTTGSGWQLKVFNSWNAGLAGNSGTAADFTNASWNGHINASSWVDFGFQATWGPTDQQPQAKPECTASVTAS